MLGKDSRPICSLMKTPVTPVRLTSVEQLLSTVLSCLTLYPAIAPKALLYTKPDLAPRSLASQMAGTLGDIVF